MSKICIVLDENVEKIYRKMKVDPSVVVQNLCNMASQLLLENKNIYETGIQLDEVDIAEVILSSADRSIDKRSKTYERAKMKSDKMKEKVIENFKKNGK